MDISLVDAYEMTDTDWTKLNPKQIEYLDKIFGMAVKMCILFDEPLSILGHELKEIANGVKKDPIFTTYKENIDEDFSEFIPGSFSED